MNTITSKAFQHIAFLLGMSLLALVAVLFVPTHFAHAQGFGDDGSIDGGGYGGDYTGGDFSSYGGFGDTSDCSSCGYTSGYSDYSTPYSTGYSTGYGYSLPYSTGYSTGYGYSLPYSTGYMTAPSNTNVNENTCTTNSCNTTNNNNVTNPAPIIYNPVITTGGSSAPSYPVYVPSCSTCSCYGNCYQPYPVVPSTPIAYNYPPSISLSAVPYTGLDLSPTEEVLYWSFLVLWCAVAAYLIAVKRVQISLVRWLNKTLFGSTTLTTSSATKTPVAAKTRTAPVAKTVAKEQSADAIDPFVLSQVNR